MPRLFISHSSKDNVLALAFQNWLLARGWSPDDIFLDLHDIGAGERWRDTLRKANASCEAVLLLASPESVNSLECQRELNLAEDLGKEIIVAILRDLQKNDSRLARWADRQFVDLSEPPLGPMEPVKHLGQLNQVSFNLAALNAIAERLSDLGIAPGSFKWEPRTLPDGSVEGPYPGLAAFGEGDAGIFFGREADTLAGLTKLRQMRKRGSPRLLVIEAASGAGKSSYLRAGLWPRLKRDTDFAPLAILRPALGIISGPDGLGRALAPWFQRHGTNKVPGDIALRLQKPGAEAAIALASLLAEATNLATIDRRAGSPEARPPAPLLAIDQGEELFAAENAVESERFLELLTAVLKEPPPNVDPYVLVTIRADSVEALLQRWPALGLDKPETEYLPPLAPSAYRDVIVKPAQVYTERVRRLDVEPALVDQLARDAQGADALPLLAFTLEKLFQEFGADGKLTVERYQGMGGIGGSIDRALLVAKKLAGPVGTDEALRRLVVPGLATWDPTANAAKKLVTNERDLLSGDRANLAPLADALVANRLLTRGSGTIEVAHEALLRRPLIAGWLEAQKDALKLRDDILKEAQEWGGGAGYVEGLVRRGARLEAALTLGRNSDFASTLAPAKDYLSACLKQETAGKRGARRTQAAIYTLLIGIIAGLLGFINQDILRERYHWYAVMQPTVLSAADEREKASNPGPNTTFAECANGCPTMVVISAGKFMMGSGEGLGEDFERPVREVTVSNSFAVSRTEITFGEWDVCVAAKRCPNIADNTWGRGTRPAILVSWEEARQYVAWLSSVTGKMYRLLSEAEWEYAARAGSVTKWSFGDDESAGGDYAWHKGNSNSKTQPVAQKKPNAFGLFDMHGNVWEWTEDCDNNYQSAPSNAAAVTSGACKGRSLRGGSWFYPLSYHRSAYRGASTLDDRNFNLGFRIARTLRH